MDNKKNMTEMDVAKREYNLVKWFMCSGMKNCITDRWCDEIDKILIDTDYQKRAIKLVTNDIGITTLAGIITPSILITNSHVVDSEILDELLNNIMLGYIDEEKSERILNFVDLFGLSYLEQILMYDDIKLKREYQKIISDEVISKYKSGIDLDLLKLFFMCYSIDNEYKEKVVEIMLEDDLYMLQESLENDTINALSYVIKETNDVVGIIDEEDECDELEEEKISVFEDVMKLIDKRLNS